MHPPAHDPPQAGAEDLLLFALGRASRWPSRKQERGRPRRTCAGRRTPARPGLFSADEVEGPHPSRRWAQTVRRTPAHESSKRGRTPPGAEPGSQPSTPRCVSAILMGAPSHSPAGVTCSIDAHGSESRSSRKKEARSLSQSQRGGGTARHREGTRGGNSKGHRDGGWRLASDFLPALPVKGGGRRRRLARSQTALHGVCRRSTWR